MANVNARALHRATTYLATQARHNTRTRFSKTTGLECILLVLCLVVRIRAPPHEQQTLLGLSMESKHRALRLLVRQAPQEMPMAPIIPRRPALLTVHTTRHLTIALEGIQKPP